MFCKSFHNTMRRVSTLVLAATIAAPVSLVTVVNAEADERVRPLTRLDTDRSGTLSLDEFLARTSAHLERGFARRDSNDDEFITEDEYPQVTLSEEREAMLSCLSSALGTTIGRPTWDEYLEMLDADADESIDLDEYLSFGIDRKTARFNAIDADDDGEITRTEMRQARVEARQQKRERRAAIQACREQLSEG